MSTFPFAMIVSQSAMSRDFPGNWNGETFEFQSALPNAPVVEPAPARTARTYRARSALAATLRRAATVVAPPAECSPAR
jgi:hypothetical protein